jgi:uncharacterized membrane protein
MPDSNAVSVSRAIDAPLDTVWAIATDLADLPETFSAITAVEILAGGDPFDVGTRWRETRTMMRREASEVMTVTRLEPKRGYTVEADNGGVHYVSTFAFAPVGEDRSEVTMTFSGEPTAARNAFMRMMGKLGLRIVRKSIEKDLHDLATAAERADAAVNPS